MGTSLDMIDRTDGHLAPDAEAIELGLFNAYDAQTETFGRGVATNRGDWCLEDPGKIPANRRKPSDGLEPSTPSLPWRCSTS